ncbi:MAG: sodium:alanine symporter family protein [Paludibacteraceae bacterium]|nr:sodium:alanine symporter family protein [Paludibacteraceae bacterium]
MQELTLLIKSLSDHLWMVLMFILIGTHLFLTVRLLGIQRYILRGIRLTAEKDAQHSGNISPFAALATSLAATIGTGNIVGVATAVTLGGPGAIFWMWITGVFGIATKYTEGVLALFYRIRQPDATFSGGPMYVIDRGLKCRWLAVLFAFFTILASFGIGSSIQCNSLTAALHEGFDIPPFWAALVVAILTAASILGGVRGIARICVVLVPLMGIFYIATCILLLVWQYETIPDSILLILHSAFDPQAAGGAFAGMGVMQAARYGIARGLFSNESGLGSAPIIAATAQSSNPVRQALISATGTFWDTVVICAITGLVIVNTGAFNQPGEGLQVTEHAFATISTFGSKLLCIALTTFTFSTILGWYIYAEKSIDFLWGRTAILPYRIVYVIATFLGGIFSLEFVWSLGDIFNGLMALPNLISLLLLSGIAVRLTRIYLWNNRLQVPAPSSFERKA